MSSGLDARSDSHFLNKMGDLAACCGYHEGWGFLNNHRVLIPLQTSLQWCPGCMSSHAAHVAASQTIQLRVPSRRICKCGLSAGWPVKSTLAPSGVTSFATKESALC